LATLWVSPLLFVVGAIWDGAMGVALASAASAWLLMPIWVVYAERGTGVGLFNMFKPAIAPTFAAIAAAAVVRFVVPLGSTLAVGLLAMPVAYLALLCAMAGGLRPIREFEESIGVILKRAPA
jgi:hypothetical protein